MAQARDIRRDIGDISPNNYVRPGVQDTSTAQIVEAVGTAGMQIDAEMAKNRFNTAIENLRTQYLTGTSAEEAAATPFSSPAPADDDSDGFVPTEQDNRALKNFGSVLDRHAQAVAQGKRSEDMFRVSAERLLRIAISKRPGLASEFRKIAQGSLGFDVVGASIDYAMKQDQQFEADQAAAAKSKADQAKDEIKRQRDVMEKVYPESAFVPDSEWASYAAKKMPSLIEISRAASAAQMAEQEQKILDAQGKKSSEADERYFITQMEALRASMDPAIDQAVAQASQPDENGRRLIDSPEGMRSVITGLRGKLISEMARIDSATAGRQIPESTKSQYRGFMDDTINRIESTLALEDDAAFMERANTILKAGADRALLSNEQAARIAAIDRNYGDVFMDRFFAQNGKTLALTAADVLTGTMPPNQMTKVGGRVVRDLVAAMFPQGAGTPADAMATSQAAEDIAKIVQNYYLQDDGNFRPQDFTQWQGQKGLLPALIAAAPTLDPHLSDEERGNIAAQIAAASGHSALRLASMMQRKMPSIVPKLDFNSLWRADTPGLMRPKAGVTLTPAEQRVLAQYGQMFNRDIITKAVTAYGGADAAASWKYIAEQVNPVLDMREQLRASAASQTASMAAGGPSGGGAGSGVQGGARSLPVGHTEDGWRYVGGDPASPSSWERE